MIDVTDQLLANGIPCSVALRGRGLRLSEAAERDQTRSGVFSERCGSDRAGPRCRTERWVVASAANWNLTRATPRPESRNNVRRTSSFRTIANPWTESWHESLVAILAESPRPSWRHPFWDAADGSHHALQTSEALGPAAISSTKDRTVARNTIDAQRSWQQDARQAGRGQKWSKERRQLGPARRRSWRPAGLFPRAAEDHALKRSVASVAKNHGDRGNRGVTRCSGRLRSPPGTWRARMAGTGMARGHGDDWRDL